LANTFRMSATMFYRSIKPFVTSRDNYRKMLNISEEKLTIKINNKTVSYINLIYIQMTNG